MPSNEIMSVEGQLVGMPLAGPESFSQQQLDYLKRALGVDETVLWSGDNGATSATLTESILNFETIKIVYAGAERYGESLVVEIEPKSYISNYGIQLTDWFINSEGEYLVCAMGFYSVSNDGKTLTGDQIKHMWFSVPNMTYSGTGTSGVKLFKIIGIHRIAGGN